MSLNGIALPANREPWLIPLQERINLFYEAHRRGKCINIMIYDHADTSTFRYRCYNLLQWTKESTKWQVVYFFRAEIDSVYPLLECTSILTLVRLQWFHAVDTLIYKARARKIPILYDVDDRVFDLDALPLLTNSIDVDFSVDGQYEYWFSYVARNGFTASKVDGFTTTNDYLGHYLQQKFNKPYRVIVNSLNQEQLAVSEECCKNKKPLVRTERQQQRIGKEKFVIGYFSGSPSHNHDLAMIASEIAFFLEKHSNAMLKVVGFMQFPLVMQPAIARGQVVFEPLTDFLKLQVLTASVNVNIVPLLENSFTNCKSELKFFEAAAVDTLTIASPTYTYAHCIRDGKNGYLCSPGQWYQRLEYVYHHMDEQQPVIAQAHKDAMTHYSGERFVRQVEEVLDFYKG